ncbi:MAG: class I SAM-dependent methyltransferase [Bacteriovoracaceae bacterium]|jgi:SAM-dependent methyltransferase|nr:class I SAM-dependent methyltransferase [Bacteriovoracaceae bacterium]
MQSSLLETVDCVCCGSHDYAIIHNPSQIDNLSREDLLKVYKSSSDEKLLNQLVECDGCGLAYLNPRVAEDIILESYSGAEDLTFVSQNEERIKTFKKSFLKFAQKYSVNIAKESKVLDIGCAGGAFPKAAHDLGFDVIGIEPSGYLCDWGKKTYGLDLRPGFLEKQNFEPKAFDVVTLWDVVEHLTDPKTELRRIGNILKDKGYLLVNYPDYNSVVAKIMGLKWPFLLSVHLFYFSPKTIKALLNDCGFEVMEVKPHWQTLKLGYVLGRAASYFSVFKIFQKVVKVIGLSNVPIAYYLGQTQVVARKL